MIDLKSFLQKYAQKLVFDVLPSVAATCIGALIVTQYINPRPADRPAQPPSVAAAPADSKATDSKAVEAKAAETKPAEMKSGDEQRPADQAVAPREAASKGKGAAPELRKAVSATDEKRDANELARAALGRLRDNEARRPAKEANKEANKETAKADFKAEPVFETKPNEPKLLETKSFETKPFEAKPFEAKPAEQKTPIQNAAVTPQATPVLPLPPAVTIAPATSVAADPANDATVQDRFGLTSRPVPPADIPVSRPPLQLHVEAQAEPQPQPKETGVVEGVMSVTKSFFRAVTPH